MLSKYVFGRKRCQKDLIVKIILYFLIFPVALAVTKKLDPEQISSLAGELCFIFVPLCSCVGISIFHADQVNGPLDEFVHKDPFGIVFSLLMLIENLLFLLPLGMILSGFGLDCNDLMIEMVVVVFFITGAGFFLSRFSGNAVFSIALILAYTAISSCDSILEIVNLFNSQGHNVFFLTSMKNKIFTDRIFLSFILAGFIFWILASVAVKKGKYR